MDYESFREHESPKHPRPHYYGDVVRKFFVAGGLLVLVALPIFVRVYPVSLLYPVFAVIILGLAAGLANPLQRWTQYVNALLSLLALIVFEWYALDIYQNHAGTDSYATLLFWLNHILAVNFFFAFYLSIKTIRGMFLKEKNFTKWNT